MPYIGAAMTKEELPAQAEQKRVEGGAMAAESGIPSPKEAAIHAAAIDALANETHRPIAEIKPHYDSALRRLQDGARVRDFLSVCASRHAREALRHGAR